MEPIAVIGSGLGGLAAATAVAEAGFKVILVEKGSAFDPSSSHIHRYDFERLSQPWKDSSNQWNGNADFQRVVGLGGNSIVYQAVAHLPKPSVLDRWGLTGGEVIKEARVIADFLRIAGMSSDFHPLNDLSKKLLYAAQQLKWSASPSKAAI